MKSVTLMCIDCIDVKRAEKVLNHCAGMMDFGAVKLLTSCETDSKYKVQIMPLNSLISYSIFMLSKCHEFIDTEHVLIVQRDGWILSPSAFKTEWLKYDYIAPLFMQYDHVGSGGFSLRSKRMMQDASVHVSKHYGDWDGSSQNACEIQDRLGYYEDGILSLSPFGKKYNIATLNDGADFGQGGNRNPKYLRPYPFGFHRTFQDIDFKTGLVSSDVRKDIKVTYDDVIDSL